MPKLPAAVVLVLLSLVRPALSQTSPAADRPPGPGDPLPEITLDYDGPGGQLEWSGNQAILTRGRLMFGDVRLQADRIEYDSVTQRIAAAGSVVLTRGDETMRGDSFVFDPENAEYVAEGAVAVSPPFYVSGARIERTTTGLLARDALVTACPEGRGEFRITARQIELVNDRYLVLRRPSFSLFGMRLLTLPRFRYVVRRGRRREREEYALSIPIRIRSSRIAGMVVGASYPFYLGKGYEASVGLDLPSKRPLQYALTLRRDLLRDQPEERPRGLFSDPTRRDAPDQQDVSPLRAFLRARPLPPPPDPVLDFEDIVRTENPVSFPTRTPARELRGQINLWGNNEIGNKRRANLLLSRLPEIRVTGRLPLAGLVPNENEQARAYLRRPRLLLTGDLALGQYEERELEGTRRATSRSRLAATAGIGTLPLLLGSRFLVRPQLLLTHQSYNRGAPYQVAELNVAGNYVLGARSAIGAAYIRRFTSGTTPFTFDLVETKHEVQVRAQAALSGKYTLGALGRYDADQQQFFDFELALAIRLRCIEPRITYRRLGQQIGLNIILPGLME